MDGATGREVAVVDGEQADTGTGESVDMALAPTSAAERHALAQRREMVGGLIRPVAPIDEIVAAQEQVREVIQKALKEGRDYGTIPGTGKPTMLKPGAERVNAAYGVYPDYEVMEKEIDHDRENTYMGWEWHPSIRGKKVDVEKTSYGLYRYVMKCFLIHRESGVVIGSGVGSCSTMESKYVSRPRDLENTVFKMAKKRAYVDATLSTFGLSDQFTQDIEDNPEAFGGRSQGSRRGESGGGSQAADQDPRQTKDDFLDSVAPGKKAAGRTWRQMVAEDRGFVRWAIDNFNTFSDQQRQWLTEAADAAKLAEAAASGQGTMPLDGTLDAESANEPADQAQLATLDRLIHHKDCPAEVTKYAKKKIAEGLTQAGAKFLIARTQAKLEEIQAAKPQPSDPFGDLDDDLPFE